MRKAKEVYVATVVGIALLSSAAVYVTSLPDRAGDVVTLALLCALALLAEILGFAIAEEAAGSVAFIAYLAMVLLAPSWQAVLGVTLVRTLSSASRRRPPIKALFNVAQHAAFVAVAILAYRAMGGVGVRTLVRLGIYEATLRDGRAAYVAVVTALSVNTILVTGILAITRKQSLIEVWREVFLPSLAMNLLAPPVIFLFTWFFAAYGPFAAAVLWAPILGFRQVHKSKSDLERINRELLELVVKSIEARDPYTSGHSRRVQRYSTVIARAIGLREKQTRQIGQAALLHDVGKIYEKYAPILAKPDKLTADEWATMQEHPVDGANLVAMMSNLKEIVPAIRHHHEKWDGSGYPDGLRGESIPLASRIITFADAIDAMTSERPYRRSIVMEQVRAEIVRCRGQQFDPQLADRLLASPAWNSLFTPGPSEAAKSANLRVVRMGELRAHTG